MKHLDYESLFSISNTHLYLEWSLSRNNQHDLYQIDVEQLNIVNGCSQEITDIPYVICMWSILSYEWVLLETKYITRLLSEACGTTDTNI